ncbi:Crp/Fnr family transcriptional regulator [Paenibacillus sp.]|uniref:Crp/Fnr family transcriptional regulator n=1 Tax=Paenibacillus sp. TaxID=58172 RepID=UPI002D6A3987|nr:Crp/Fnr family transcriptional regulator [Paenibacillus sp.]HZG87066.1 Crp/Fnr family transcriptional regulator [Paenibacillus sp.]
MLSLLHSVPLFKDLSEEHLTRLSNICARKGFKAGTVLFREKEPGDVFYIIVSGSVKVFTSNAGGEEKILSVFQAGDNFGELSLIDGKPRSASAQVLEDSMFLTLRGTEFLHLLKQYPDMSLAIMKELCRRLRETNEHVYDLTFVDARTRVLKNLIVFANKNGIRSGNTINIRIALNYDELARMAGVSKSVLMDVIRDLERIQVLQSTPHGFSMDLSRLRPSGS